jgi:manganese/zinc/iron transport system permease protein
VLSVVTLLNAVFVLMLYKELKITSFDPATADAMGISSRWMHYVLMVLVAITAVASFESVGNILVVAMLIVPPATAFLLTRRLAVMIGLSMVIAVASAVMGHVSAITVPRWFGFGSTTTAGSMAACAGVLFGIALLFSPDQGVIVQVSRRALMSLRILMDDVVAFLYRCEEKECSATLNLATLQSELIAPGWLLRFALWRLQRAGEVQVAGTVPVLLEKGRDKARKLVRSHRLWENYLVTESNADPGRIHGQAEKLEHFTSRELRDRLDQSMDAPAVDPHGASIPSEESDGNGK